MKLKKGIPVIDQGDRLGFWGGKFGGNFVPETLKKPIEDLEILFNKLKKDKNFINERDKYFKNKDYIIDLSGSIENNEGKKDIYKIDKLLKLFAKI